VKRKILVDDGDEWMTVQVRVRDWDDWFTSSTLYTVDTSTNPPKLAYQEAETEIAPLAKHVKESDARVAWTCDTDVNKLSAADKIRFHAAMRMRRMRGRNTTFKKEAKRYFLGSKRDLLNLFLANGSKKCVWFEYEQHLEAIAYADSYIDIHRKVELEGRRLKELAERRNQRKRVERYMSLFFSASVQMTK